MNHGWQSESTDGPQVVGVVAMVAVVTLAQLVDVVWCSAVAVVVAAVLQL